jgi:hypothetical protein
MALAVQRVRSGQQGSRDRDKIRKIISKIQDFESKENLDTPHSSPLPMTRGRGVNA